MLDAVVKELSAWNPRERMGMFRRWVQGSLSLIQLHVLTILEGEGPVSMSRLAETLDVSVASATGIVDRMEQRGLVERRHDESDRRVVLVHPTAAGDAVFKDIETQRRTVLVQILSRLDNEELKACLVGMRAMARARTELTVERAAESGPASDLLVVRVRQPAAEPGA